MIRGFAEWLAKTELSLMFQNALWVVPLSQSIHIISVSVVFASAMMINLRLMGIGSSGRSISQLVDTLVPWMWRALIALVITGLVQTITEPVRQFITPIFWFKMLSIVLVSILTAVFARRVRANAAQWDASTTRPASGTAFALVSTVLWVSIVIYGRFIGYVWTNYL